TPAGGAPTFLPILARLPARFDAEEFLGWKRIEQLSVLADLPTTELGGVLRLEIVDEFEPALAGQIRDVAGVTFWRADGLAHLSDEFGPVHERALRIVPAESGPFVELVLQRLDGAQIINAGGEEGPLADGQIERFPIFGAQPGCDGGFAGQPVHG